MTETEWLCCIDTWEMLKVLRGGSERKLQLFAIACCRRIWHLLPTVAARELVEVAERYADGLATDQNLDAANQAHSFAPPDPSFAYNEYVFAYAHEAVEQATWYAPPTASGPANTVPSTDGSQGAAWASAAGASDEASAAFAAAAPDWGPRRAAERAAQCGLLRDIFGSLSRPVDVNSSWLAWDAGAAVKLARGIYAERAFDRLGDLADVLEASGCQDPAILAHCRQPAEHARGCWVVDLLLSKE